MEYLEGITLAAEIAKGAMAPEQVVRYGAQIASGLAEAHAAGIVHRDLKPANIMLTRHGVKVLDFGLAKLATNGSITEKDGVMGTPAYMSPEQIEGRELSSSTDLFSLGLVLYEMSTGRLPFPGVSLGRLMIGDSQEKAPALSNQLRDVPPGLDTLVAKLLEKNPTKRSTTASEVAQELGRLNQQLPSDAQAKLRRRLYLIAAAVAVLLLAASGLWAYRQSEQRRWAREQAIPEAARIAEQAPVAAFLLLGKARKYLPDDPQLASMEKSLVREVSIQSSPPGASLEIQDYRTPNGPWMPLGAAPESGVVIPKGYFRWRVTKPGIEPLLVAPEVFSKMAFHLASPGTPENMVHVPKGGFFNLIDFIGWINHQLPAYDIDRYEVTNRQYRDFVDKGGYRQPEFWKQKFTRDGQEISWEQAMEIFRDSTGRPGPATWEGGHYPSGRDDDPVSGVSWYEAAAYAEFAGRSLPALSQWYQAAPPQLAGYSIDQSNFGGKGPMRVGSLADQGPFGTYDMTGNVREWCLNTVAGDRRFILGGAWRTPTYQAYEPEALSPFDRSAMNGFRCVRNTEPLPADSAAPIALMTRDFSKEKPISDEIFEAYKQQYAYDRAPLDARTDEAPENTPDWTREKISIDAGYERERLPLNLFLPKGVRRPLQTVLFFPSANVNFMASSKKLGDMAFIDYVIKSGRAVAYPIYKETYERAVHKGMPGTFEHIGVVVQESKEVRRSVDYLETRPEIDRSKLAYLGDSQGTAYGVIYTALENRFKALIFLDGGFFLCRCPAAVDQVNFAPRVKMPVLMVNGRYDFSFSVDNSQEPLFRMLGTPVADKRHVLLDTSHGVSQRPSELSKEVLAWLDKYLGRVN